jgi:hypothetical protein
MISSGEKKEEYRDVKPYWSRRLGKYYNTIEFRNGYKPSSPRFKIEFKGLYVGVGEKEWGAPNRDVYVLRLGKLL